MHICYADDSGAGDARTVTGLLVEAPHWNDFLGTWLDARLHIAAEWGVRKHSELHAVDFAKGRSTYCVTDEQEGRFGKPARLAAYRVLMNRIGMFKPLTVTTVGVETRQQHVAYEHFVDHLDRWAQDNDTQVLIVLDGKGGVALEHEDQATRDKLLADSSRDSRPYRLVHRKLDLGRRRIIEDVIVHDSRFSQLVQAADLVAYSAFHHRMNSHPQHWPKIKPVDGVVKAYQRLEDRWMPGTENGITWVSQ